jgi:hypothetical protein
MDAQPAPQVMQTARTPRGEEKTFARARRWSVLLMGTLFAISLELTSPTIAERLEKRDPTRYLLTAEQIVEKDYPRSFLVRSQIGWMDRDAWA